MTHNHSESMTGSHDTDINTPRHQRVGNFIRTLTRWFSVDSPIHTGDSQIDRQYANGLGQGACSHDPGLYAAVKAHEELAALRQEEDMARESEATPNYQDN